MSKINIFWFRRDLRLFDNNALSKALNEGTKVQCVFIFDDAILSGLKNDDPRVQFIWQELGNINKELNKYDSSLLVKKGNVLDVHNQILYDYEVNKLFFNKDYEPSAIKRDLEVSALYKSKNVEVEAYKDQVIFEENEILKKDGKPYTVYTHFKNKWLEHFNESLIQEFKVQLANNLLKSNNSFPSLLEIGFQENEIRVIPYNFSQLKTYDETRDYPSINSTSYLSPHLRFGTVSVRQMVKMALETNKVFLSELIWREFFMQILYHFPKVVNKSFKEQYDLIEWENNKEHFRAWCEGKTGYPMVDAGMQELNKTGYMHNRVRMITASFLCKHLLIDWRWGEAYFAEKLLDFELASNNGNWQWAAGTGCDAAPYFRVFNPITQREKFDREGKYVKKWLPELSTFDYPKPIVEHKFARERALKRYKEGLN